MEIPDDTYNLLIAGKIFTRYRMGKRLIPLKMFDQRFIHQNGRDVVLASGLKVLSIQQLNVHGFEIIRINLIVGYLFTAAISLFECQFGPWIP